MKARLVIRGFRGLTLMFKESVEIPEDELDSLLPQLAEKHALAMAGAPHMIEIEFVDEPDPQQRFFRFGTDATRMVRPLEIDLE